MKVGLCLWALVVLAHSQKDGHDCTNKSPLCNYWGNIGECHANPRYMLPNCKGACDPLCILSHWGLDPRTCVDSNQNCETWAAAGECTANPYYMMWQCKLSCYPPCIAGDLDPSDIDCEHDEEWNAHKNQWGLTYEDLMVEQEVYKIYCKRRDFIAEFNKGNHDFELALNKYAHLTPEKLAQLKGFKPQKIQPDDQHFDDKDIGEVPDSFDWRDKGAVTPVSDQAFCGSCFAFASVAAIESHNKIKNNKLFELSQQQVLDCSPYDPDGGNIGCGGGNPGPTFNYVRDAGGIETNESYPYDFTQYDNEKRKEKDMTVGPCKFDKTEVVVKVTGFVRVTHPDTTMDAEKIKKAVAGKGPVTAAINTSGGGTKGVEDNVFGTLSIGVYNDEQCDKQKNKWNTDHLVLIVGYGTTDKGKDDTGFAKIGTAICELQMSLEQDIDRLQ